MIELSATPLNKEALENLVKEVANHGYDGEAAQRITDESAALVIATLRNLDEKIKSVSTDDVDRTVIQQIVLYNLLQAFHRAMEANAIEFLLNILRGGARS